MLENLNRKKLAQFAKYHLKRRVFDHPASEDSLGVELIGLDLDELYRILGERCPDAEKLATVTYRGKSYPIFRVDTGDIGARKKLFVISGIHGNEQAGVLSIPALLDDVDQQPDLYRGVHVVVITPTNPVGADHQSRYNALGFDINRDFGRFETVEGRAVRDACENFRPDFTISLHEGPQPGAFVFANRSVSEFVGRGVVADMKEAGVELADRDYFGRQLSPPGYAPVSRRLYALSLLWKATLGMVPFGVYADLRGLPEITLETSWSSPNRDARIAAHLEVMRAVVRRLR